MKKNQLISAKQPSLIITRNGFDIIVNQANVGTVCIYYIWYGIK